MTTSMEGERDFGSAATTTPRTGSGDLWIVVFFRTATNEANPIWRAFVGGTHGDPGPLHGRAPWTGAGSMLRARVRRRGHRSWARLRDPRPDPLLRRRRRPTLRHRRPPRRRGGVESPSRDERKGRHQAPCRPDAGGQRGPWRRGLGPALQTHADAYVATSHVRPRVPHLRCAYGRQSDSHGLQPRGLPARELHAGGPQADRRRVQRRRRVETRGPDL